MARLSDDGRTRLEGLTVTLLLELRREYLAAGASALKHWDQLQSRMLAAARTTDSVPEWLSSMCRALQLGAPLSSTCSAASALQRAVLADGGRAAEWLDLLEREHAFLIASARLEAERRKETKDAGLAEKIASMDADRMAEIFGLEIERKA